MKKLLACLAIPLLTWSTVQAQTTGPFNEREAPPQANIQDTKTTWTMEFRFKDPRLIVVDVPKRGKRVVWYMWYQVINRTKEPRLFMPDFQLVTLDKHTVHNDQVLAFAEETIKRTEDPTGYLDIKNSVTMSRQPIPVTKEDSAPRTVTGIALWDDVFGQPPDTTRFSIFVTGLSNGIYEDKEKEPGVVRRKTLQLNFKRLSDRNHLNAEVKFIAPVEWLYRSSPKGANLRDDLKPGAKEPEMEKKEPEKKEPEKKEPEMEKKEPEKKDPAMEKKEPEKKDPAMEKKEPEKKDGMEKKEPGARREPRAPQPANRVAGARK